jgi:predicted nucleic acid-binding protein
VTAFLDTNILIYRIDRLTPAKQRRAHALIDELYQSGEAVVSTQVLQEFYNTATGMLRVPSDIAAGIAKKHASGRLVQVTPPLIYSAMTRHAAGQFHFWDALIVEAALAGGAKVLYTEDMQDGLNVDGLSIRNPFLAN